MKNIVWYFVLANILDVGKEVKHSNQSFDEYLTGPFIANKAKLSLYFFSFLWFRGFGTVGLMALSLEVGLVAVGSRTIEEYLEKAFPCKINCESKVYRTIVAYIILQSLFCAHDILSYAMMRTKSEMEHFDRYGAPLDVGAP